MTKQPPWSEIDALLDRALDLGPEERERFLATRCPDEETRALVERLLARAESEGPLRTGGALEGDEAEPASEHETLEPGAVIDGYRLARRIGRGGMGEVWEAQQTSPVRRRVALKLVHAGLDSPQVEARFEVERQALAQMNHPNVAQVYGGGRTPSGCPYLVMELLDGLPVTEFCDAHRLDVEARLELFLEVCAGVQHAHQRGIIHRDLKPSNVLVTESTGGSLPKIIDFGVARTEELSRAEALLTLDGQILGTPEYMSPEQADPEAVDVDTRTDVYGLGALLYELLAGAPPFERRPGLAGLGDLLRRIRSEDPVPPSRRIAESDQAAEIAAHRSLDPATLARRLRDDLDVVVSKALAKDRERRYASPRELAEDIRRHLADLPVRARPPSLLYRMRKLARRRRGPLLAAILVTFLVAVGSVGTITGLLRARRESLRAQSQAEITAAVNEFLNDDLLAAAAPEEAGGDVTMRQVLAAASARVPERFADRPLVEAEIQTTLGRTWVSLGDYAEARKHLERALDLRRPLLGEADPKTVETLEELARLDVLQGRLPEAERRMRRAVDLRTSSLGPLAPETIRAANGLGLVFHAGGRYEEAERTFRDVLDRARRALGPEDPETVDLMNNLGVVLQIRGRLDEAADLLREALVLTRTHKGIDHPDTFTSMNNLGRLMRQMRRWDEAERLYREVVEGRRRVLGSDHPDTLNALNNLGYLLAIRDRLEEAEPLYREALEGRRRALGDGHPLTVASLASLGEVVARRGGREEGEALLLEALEASRALGPGGDQVRAGTLSKYADFLLAEGRGEDAEPLYRESHELYQRVLGPEHAVTRAVAGKLARLQAAAPTHLPAE